MASHVQPKSSQLGSVVIATTTWSCDDIIEQFLEHHLAGDIARIFLMDFGSDDGTLELLRPYCDSGSVELLKLESLHGKDSSNFLLDHIRRRVAPPQWCLFIDPDEFISAPATLAKTFADVPEDIQVVNIPRFNVTGVRPDRIQDVLIPFVDLNLKIRQRIQRSAFERRARELLTPWIFTDIPGKVAVRVKSEVTIGDGDHTASGNTGYILSDQEIFHFPIRSLQKFEQKIKSAKMDFEANPHLGPDFGWHARRWIAVHEDRGLASEFLQQFIDRSEVDRLIEHGVLERIQNISSSKVVENL